MVGQSNFDEEDEDKRFLVDMDGNPFNVILVSFDWSKEQFFHDKAIVKLKGNELKR